MREITLHPGTSIEIDGVRVRAVEPAAHADGSKDTNVKRVPAADNTALLNALQRGSIR